MASLPPLPDGTQSVQRVFSLLRTIALHNRGGLRIVDLCRLTDLRRPTLHRLVQCLEREGYVTRNSRTRSYHLGPMLHELGISATPGVRLEDVCRSHLRSIADSTGDLVFLTQRSRWDAVCIDKQAGNHWARTFTLDVGTRRPLGVGAGSLAILSALPSAEIQAAIDINGPALQEFEQLTTTRLKRLVRETQTRGFAVHDGLRSGARALGFAMRNEAGVCVAAISISADRKRLPESRWSELSELLRKTTSRIQRGIP